MSGRSGVGQTRGATLGPQPLKATIPYQLASKARPNWRDGKTKSHQLSSGMRRTMSLDAIIGPYLQGHWPKEPEGQSSLSRKDKSTQLLEVPDGHRAPVPPQSLSSGSQSDPSTTPLSQPCSSSSSTSSSPCSSPTYLSNSPPDSEDLPSEADLSLPLLLSSSPRPNKSCCFQREPPEGCEKVRVWEETRLPALISSCPDLNKVNFTPHGGSAFCPVSLLKPLLPSMDLLLRSLTVSPVVNTGLVWVSRLHNISEWKTLIVIL
uniref:Protein FAM117A-like n=1 Tax=Myripristis murdjan TaxID=586833 RepID=A0A668AVZ7_9TELE